MSSRVLSFLRLRPSTNPDKPHNFLRTSDTTALDVQSSTTHHFQHVFEADSDQKAVYDGTVGWYVAQFFTGTSLLVLTWGPTNSGKTYTMCGDSNHPGLLPRVCAVVGKRLSELLAVPNEMPPTMKCSYVEVYNEQIYDLLATVDADTPRGGSKSRASSATSKLKIETDRNGSTHVRGLEEIIVKSTEELLEMVARGQANRTLEATSCNGNSSRSHCVLTLTLQLDSKHCSRLCLVDLAGSEGVKKTSHPIGTRLAEANHINKSLGVLGRCFDALNKGSSHVPFRSSKLTMLLSPFFTGSSIVQLIVSINPDPACASENANALKYAAMASDIPVRSKVDTGKPLLSTVEEDGDAFSSAQSRHPVINEVRDLVSNALGEAESLARELAHTERQLCGDESPFLLPEDLDGEDKKSSTSSNKRAKLSPRDSASSSPPTSQHSPSETVSALRAQLQQVIAERDDHKRRAAYVSAQLENPFLVVASTEGRALMAEGAVFTRVFLRDSQVASCPVFVFLKPRGPIGELHWMTADKLSENANAFNLMTGEIKTDSLPLHLVSDVHMGKCTKSLKSNFSAGYHNNCCFSVSSTATGQILNLVAPFPERAFTWLFGINCLLTRLGKGVRVEDDDLLSPHKKHPNHVEEALHEP